MKILRNALFLAAFGTVAAAFGQSAPFVPGELLVKFVPGQGPGINSAVHATEVSYNQAIGVSKVKLPGNLTVNQALSYYRSQVGVAYATPNYIAKADFVPNDPMYGQQYGPQKIKCPAAWDVMRGIPSVKIAIIDTGIDYTHPDLAGKVLPGKDFVNSDDDAMDDNGHGTHCGGNAAALTNNSVGIAGIAPNCSLIPVKVLSGGGSGSYDWIIGGITWAADNGANVLSMSLGGSGASQAMQDALQYALTKGCIICASAGNAGTTDFNYPGAYPECIAVAATDQNDQKADFSTYGDWVDVAAPGVNILSTLPGGGYGGESGTSMSCPIVAGLAGLIKSMWTAGTNVQIRAQIENNCDAVGNFVIHGRVNALRSIPTIAITDPISFPVSAISLFEGSKAYNTLNQARVSDNTYYAISSKYTYRLGHVATAKASFISTKSITSLSNAKIKLEASAANYVSGSTFVWDNSTSSWKYLGAFPLSGTDQAKEFALPTPYKNFFDANKQCQVLFRGIMPDSPTRPPFQFALRIDLAQLNARIPR